MKVNVGSVDRITRYVLAVALVVVGLFVLSGIEGNVTGIVVAVASVLPIVTATTRKCPVYAAVGVSTCAAEAKDKKG